MSEQKKLVIVNSRGFDDERSSVAWSIANTAVASNMDVTVFLVATMNDMIGNFLENGGRILICPPCAKVRGYSEDSLIDGVTIAGAPVMLEEMQQNAGALTF
jgi:predicted peroxiredoxin